MGVSEEGDAEDKLLGRVAHLLMASSEPSSTLVCGEEWPPGFSIPGFILLSRLGQGSMGIVYEAQQMEPDRKVAVKIPKAALGDRTQRECFRAEVAALAKLEHPSIARVYEAHVEGGLPYVVMEYVEGVALDKRTAQFRGELVPILALFKQAAEAVAFIHSHGILHRDIKPSNILAKDNSLKIVDFGLAGRFHRESAGAEASLDGSTKGSERVGTLLYMAPEVMREDPGSATPRADVYSLGVLLFRLVTGQFPHEPSGSEAELMVRIMRDEPRHPHQARRDIPGDLCAVMMRAIAAEVGQRYASAADLAEDVGRFLENRPVKAKVPSWAYRARKHARRNWKYWIFGGVALAGAIAYMVMATQFGRREQYIAAALSGQLSQADTDLGISLMLAGKSDEALGWYAVALRREPGQQAAARAAGNTLLHGGLLAHLGRAELKANMDWQTYQENERMLFAPRRNPKTEHEWFFPTYAGVEHWDMRYGRLIQVIAPVAEGAAVKHVCCDVLEGGLVAVGVDQNLSIWRLRETAAELVAQSSYSEPIRWLRYSDDGQSLLVFLQSENVCVCLGKEGEERHRFTGSGLFSGPNRVATTRIPSILVALESMGGGEAVLKRWDLHSGQPLPDSPGIPLGLDDLAICRGATAAEVALFQPQGVGIYDVVSGGLKFNSKIPRPNWPFDKRPLLVGKTMHAQLCEERGELYAAQEDAGLRVFSAGNGEMISKHIQGEGFLRGAFFSRIANERHWLLGIDYNRAATLWDWSLAQPVAPKLLLKSGPILGGGFLGDGRLFTLGEEGKLDSWRVCDPLLSAPAAEHLDGWATNFEMDSAGSKVLASSSQGGAVLISIPKGEIRKLKHSPAPAEYSEGSLGGCARLSPDGKLIAAWESPRALTVASVVSVLGDSWRVELNAEERGTITCCAFTPDSRWLVVGTSEGFLSVWQIAARKREVTLPLLSAPIAHLVFSRHHPSQFWLAVGSIQGEAKVLLADRWRELPMALQPRLTGLRELQFHPTEPYLFAIHDSSRLELARVTESVVEWSAAPLEFDQTVRAVACSPDGASIAVGSLSGRIEARKWADGAIGAVLRSFRVPAVVNSVAFSPDGSTLAAGSYLLKLHVWEMATGRDITPPMKTHFGNEGHFRSVKFSPDGRWLCTAESSHSVSLRPFFSPKEAAPAWFMDWLEGIGRLRARPDQNLMERLEPVALDRLLALAPPTDQGSYAEFVRQFTEMAISGKRLIIPQ